MSDLKELNIGDHKAPPGMHRLVKRVMTSSPAQPLGTKDYLVNDHAERAAGLVELGQLRREYDGNEDVIFWLLDEHGAPQEA